MSILNRLVYRRRVALRLEKAYLLALAIIAAAIVQLAV